MRWLKKFYICLEKILEGGMYVLFLSLLYINGRFIGNRRLRERTRLKVSNKIMVLVFMAGETR